MEFAVGTDTGPSFRHGDWKPANIPWFRDKDDKDAIGTLKIDDWGLAKEHATIIAVNKTSAE